MAEEEEERKTGYREIILPHDEVDRISELTEDYLNSSPVEIIGRFYCVVSMRHETAGENVIVVFGIQEMPGDTCD
jgi:hypothetical protein